MNIPIRDSKVRGWIEAAWSRHQLGASFEQPANKPCSTATHLRLVPSASNEVSPARDNGARQWFRVEPKKGKHAEVLIYDEIGVGFFGGGVAAEDLINELRGLKLTSADELTVRINSPGGSMFEGNSIYNYLRTVAATVVVRIDGVAASAASIIAMAGDRIEMPANAMLFIHNPWMAVSGDAKTMRKTADDLDRMRDGAVATYMRRAGDKLAKAKLVEMLDAETWLSADDSVRYGLADVVDEPVRALNLAKFDFSKYGFAVPKALRPTEALRQQLRQLTKVGEEVAVPRSTTDRQRQQLRELAVGGDTRGARLREHPAMVRHKRDHAELVRDQVRSEYGLSCLGEHCFDVNKPRRFISGVAISSSNANANGHRFIAKGLKFSLPCPLLLDHKPGRVVGRVLSCYEVGDQVWFTAELANADVPFADLVWSDITWRRLASCSVGSVDLEGSVSQSVAGVLPSWGLRELSVVILGADRGAKITQCWDRLPDLDIDGVVVRPTKTHWKGPLSGWESEEFMDKMSRPRKSDVPDPPPRATRFHRERAELARLKEGNV